MFRYLAGHISFASYDALYTGKDSIDPFIDLDSVKKSIDPGAIIVNCYSVGLEGSWELNEQGETRSGVFIDVK